MTLVDHLASIVTLIGFPLVLIGFVDLYRERQLSMWKVRKWVGIVLLLAGFAAWSSDVADRLGYVDLKSLAAFPNTGPIVWNFEETASGHGYFLNMQKPTNGEPRIVGFGAHGKNTSSEPISNFNAYLRSDSTNETIPIYIIAVESGAANVCTPAVPTLPEDTLGIPPFADFDIVSYKKPFFINVLSPDAVPLSKFLSDFVPFTIVMSYDGRSYERHFSKEEVDRQVALLEKITAPITIPHVVRKQSAPMVIPQPLFTPVPTQPAPPAPASPDITGKTPGN
jgi:hypothetical protein